MYIKFMHSVKPLSCLWIFVCCLLTSVSHSADTNDGIQELPVEINTHTPNVMPQTSKEEAPSAGSQMHDEQNDVVSESTNDISIENKVGLSAEPQTEEALTMDIEVSPENTEIQTETANGDNADSNSDDFLQLPTMDEFITQSKLKPEPSIPNTNGAASADSSLPASFSDSTQTPSTSNNNQKEHSINGHEVPPKQKNYASADCGAKIVASNPESRNSGGILNENRDDYMLNKCSLEALWVTVELCDYIQVLSIELSVHELFSSLPENFTMSLSLQGGVKLEDWLPATTFTAKNVRGEQIFRVPAAEQHHARFVKLNFLSHYGSEHYCPITTLRVFGANYVEVLEAIERGSAAHIPPLSLDTNDSDPDTFEAELSGKDEKAKDGFFTNALDGIYKLVWSGGEQVPPVNIASVTQHKFESKIETSIDLSDEISDFENDSSQSEPPKESIKVGLEQKEDSAIEITNISNATLHKDVSNTSVQHSAVTVDPEESVALETNIKQQTSESSIHQDLVSSSLSEEKYNSSDSPHPDNDSVETADLVSNEKDTEMPDNTTHPENTVSNSTQATPPDNSSSLNDSTTTSPKDAPLPSSPPASQNYLVRMQERIARLGENVSLIHRYLDQFRHSIQRNVNRTEEVQRSLERKLSQLEDLVNLTLLNGFLQSEELESTKAYWTDTIASLRAELQSFKSQFYIFFLLTLLVCVITAAVIITRHNNQLRKEMNSLSQQFNSEFQKVFDIIAENENSLSSVKMDRLHPIRMRNKENDEFGIHLADQDVLSDSHVNAYVHRNAKKKRKTRKTSNFPHSCP